MQVLLYAVPAFFTLIAIEWVWDRSRHPDEYKTEDALTNISCGVGSDVFKFIFLGFNALVYSWVLDRYGVWEISNTSVIAWISCFILNDMGYYWFHRVSHRVNLLWASHIVHHQSEYYNLSVALRQSFLNGIFAIWFYLPLAWMGFPLEMYLTCKGLDLIYQFWIHTQRIERFPRWVEWIMNTPSHHRVHHGTNPQYLDKNYAGTFIVFDRMFGTFEPEVEKVKYGITRPLGTYNSVWAQIHCFVDLWKNMKLRKGLGDKLLIWIQGPETMDLPYEPSHSGHQAVTGTGPGAVLFLMSFALGLGYFYMGKDLGFFFKLSWAVLIAVLLWFQGSLFDGLRDQRKSKNTQRVTTGSAT